jgi:peptide deformylase
MDILLYENEQELPMLRKSCNPIAKSLDVTREIAQMFNLMHKANGIGLAAPQVGIASRFFVMDIDDNPMVFINPEILSTSIEMSVMEEGCLSLPKLYAKVKRPSFIKMRAMNLKRQWFTIEATGLEAVCLQHEYDHLDGILFIDHLSERDQKNALKAYERLVSMKYTGGLK